MYFGRIKKTLLTNESIFAGTPVLTITAKDRDSGDFGTEGIVYQVIIGSIIILHWETMAQLVTITALSNR